MGMLRWLIAASALLAVAAGASAEPAAPSEEHPLVSFLPPVKYVEPGALCTLQVMVDDAVDSLSCMGVYIALDDTAVADVAIAYEGRLFKTAGYPTFFRWEEPSPDSANAIDCLLGYRSYFLTPGELVKFVFRAKALGTCTVSFTELLLWDIDRVELEPVAGPDAEIIVRHSTGCDPPAPPRGAFFNYPNPFHPATVLVLDLFDAGRTAAGTEATVDIYDVSGAHVRSLFRGFATALRSEILWDGTDDAGRPGAAGVYLAVASTARATLTRKLILVR